jgi:hypothetical protein
MSTFLANLSCLKLVLCNVARRSLEAYFVEQQVENKFCALTTFYLIVIAQKKNGK